jgi:hypothetical protein
VGAGGAAWIGGNTVSIGGAGAGDGGAGGGAGGVVSGGDGDGDTGFALGEDAAGGGDTLCACAEGATKKVAATAASRDKDESSAREARGSEAMGRACGAIPPRMGEDGVVNGDRTNAATARA